MMNRDLVWPAAITAWAMAALVAMASAQPSLFRQVVVFSFMLFCPGVAFVRLLDVKDFLPALALVLALSMALDTLVAETMVLAHAWSPLAGQIVLVCSSVAGALLQVRRARTEKGRAAP